MTRDWIYKHDPIPPDEVAAAEREIDVGQVWERALPSAAKQSRVRIFLLEERSFDGVSYRYVGYKCASDGKNHNGWKVSLFVQHYRHVAETEADAPSRSKKAVG